MEYLVGHHHTYGSNIVGLDYRILVEADFLVNLFEKGASKDAVLSARKNIFNTKKSGCMRTVSSNQYAARI